MTATATPSATDAIVSFATGGWAMRIPIRESGRTVLANVLARAIAGASDAAVERTLATRDRGEPRLAAYPIGRSERVGAIDAALLGGIAAGSVDSLATPVACAALAAGEAANAAGAAVLDAIVVGCEVAVRLAASLGASHVARGWDVDGTCGRIGAAVAASRAFALNAERTRNALGIAATDAGGLRIAHGTQLAAYVRGAAAADGVEAALLARFGFTGAPQSIDGRRGLAALMSGTFDAAAIADGLGERYTFTELSDATSSAGRAALPTAVGGLLDRIERLPAIGELVAATRGSAAPLR
jgi:2-methylcitrate dehydratase PrpD